MITKLREWGVPVALLKSSGGIAEYGDGAAEKFRYGESERISVGRSPFFDSSHIHGDYVIPRPYVCIYEDAKLLGPAFPLGLTPDGRPIKEVARNQTFGALLSLRKAGNAVGWGRVAAELFSAPYPSPGRRPYLESVIPFTQPMTTVNYFHWVTETLPRVRGARAYTAKTGENPLVLVNPGAPSWMIETLELLDIETDRIRRWTDEIATAGRLVVPDYRKKITGGPFYPSRADLVWVRDELEHGISLRAGNSPDRIFVSRQDAERRQVTNYEKIAAVAREFDFDIIVPSEHSVTEQVQLFQDAELIAGPHGAGLTNMLFTTNSTVLELYPQNISRHCYFLMCELLGFDYRVVIGGEANPHFPIDPDLFRATLQDVV